MRYGRRPCGDGHDDCDHNHAARHAGFSATFADLVLEASPFERPEQRVLDSRLALPVNTVLNGGYRILRAVGSGGFGITYEAEDKGLGAVVGIKEYYPVACADRDNTMRVQPSSEHSRRAFDWGRDNFLQEARTLARFDHPSIVRITRVFEANSTAYMVMRFEIGLSFYDWLARLGRPPTQAELDMVTSRLLDALEVVHEANFLHRDISPDNIIMRPDGTPVLLDFGTAGPTLGGVRCPLAGIVKAGYSPHELYASDTRLQGAWSDIYALGGILYLAVTGRPPVESTLRAFEDCMPPASESTTGGYRRAFVAAIDACLRMRHSERPQSVAQLRQMLCSSQARPVWAERLFTSVREPIQRSASTLGQIATRSRQGRRQRATANVG